MKLGSRAGILNGPLRLTAQQGTPDGRPSLAPELAREINKIK